MYNNNGLLTVDNNIYTCILCIAFYALDKLESDD